MALRNRLLRVLEGYPRSGGPGLAAGLEHLTRCFVYDIDLIGATITLMGPDGTQGVAAASDRGIHGVDAVQFDVGEGPSRDAFSSGRPVLVVDVTRVDGRWPGFLLATRSHGVGAVYAFPLQYGATKLGVLTGYAPRPRSLTAPEVSTCATYAEVSTDFIIDRSTQDGHAPDGFVEDEVKIRTQVYQAQGMVMVELGVSLAEALVRLRAAAFAAGLPLNELAADLVEGRRPLNLDGQPRDIADGPGA